MKEDTDKNNFSLFREYVKQLMDYGKKFIIIGNGNAVTYKEIFPLIKNNQLWLGHKSFSGGMNMYAGPSYEAEKCKHPKYDENGRIIINVMMCVWFTNVEHKKRHTPIDLYKRYSDEYPKYDNYDAIDCGKVAEIPMDYNGVVGVPITFLDKYCPEQFEIIGGFNGYKESGEANGLLCGTLTEYIDKNGKVKTWTGPTINKKTCYYRLLIRKRNA